MAIELSQCKRCDTRFQPWELRCPKCNRSLPVVGASLLLILLFAGLLIAEAVRWLGLW